MKYGILKYSSKPELVSWTPQQYWDISFKYFPRLTVDAFIVSNNKVCLVKRTCQPFQGYWHLPGGFVRKGENLPAALKRIVRAETGLEIEVEKPIGIFELYDPRGHLVTIVWKCSLKTDASKENVKFFPFTALPRNIGFCHREIIQAVWRCT